MQAVSILLLLRTYYLLAHSVAGMRICTRVGAVKPDANIKTDHKNYREQNTGIESKDVSRRQAYLHDTSNDLHDINMTSGQR